MSRSMWPALEHCPGILVDSLRGDVADEFRVESTSFLRQSLRWRYQMPRKRQKQQRRTQEIATVQETRVCETSALLERVLGSRPRLRGSRWRGNSRDVAECDRQNPLLVHDSRPWNCCSAVLKAVHGALQGSTEISLLSTPVFGHRSMPPCSTCESLRCVFGVPAQLTFVLRPIQAVYSSTPFGRWGFMAIVSASISLSPSAKSRLWTYFRKISTIKMGRTFWAVHFCCGCCAPDSFLEHQHVNRLLLPASGSTRHPH